MTSWRVFPWAALLLVFAAASALAAPAQPVNTTILFEAPLNALHQLGVQLVESDARTTGNGTHVAQIVLRVNSLSPSEVAVIKMDIDVWAPNGTHLGQISRSPVVSLASNFTAPDVVLFNSQTMPEFQRGSTIRFRVTSAFLLPGVPVGDPYLDGYEPRCPGGFASPAARCNALFMALKDALQPWPQCSIASFDCSPATLHPVERDCHYPDVLVDWDIECG